MNPASIWHWLLVQLRLRKPLRIENLCPSCKTALLDEEQWCFICNIHFFKMGK